MKKPDDAIFWLLQRLSKQEKKLIRAMLNGEGKKSYLLTLFGLIENLDTYDEQVLKSRLKNAALKKDFKIYKNLLYQAVLKGLMITQLHGSSNKPVQYYLLAGAVLNKKGLKAQAKKLLVKGTELEETTLLHELEAMRLQSKMPAHFSGTAEISSYYKLMQEKAEALKRELKYEEINRCFRYLIQKYVYAIEKGVKKQFDELIKLNGKKEEQALTVYSKLLFNKNHFYYYFYTLQLKEAERYLLRQEEILMKDNGNTEHGIHLHIELLREKGLFIMEQRLKEKLRAFLVQMDDFIRKNAARMNQEEYSTMLIFEMNVKGGFFSASVDFSGGINYLKSRYNFIRRQGIVLHPASVLTYQANLLVMNFMNGDFKIALNHCNHILNSAYLNVRQDIYYAVRLLNLLCHYELKHTDYLPALIRSTFRLLMKKEKIHKYEKEILCFFKELPKVNSKKAFKLQLQSLLAKLEELQSDPLERITFAYFDYIIWIKSKLVDKPVVELLRKNE